MNTFVVLPGAPGLLPCQGQQDPFEPVRTAAVEALRQAEVGAAPAAVWSSSDQAWGVGLSLLRAAGWQRRTSREPEVTVIVGNGSAMRGEQAPGHFDPRSLPFDHRIEVALRDGDAHTLAGIDISLAAELWADVGALVRLGQHLDGRLDMGKGRPRARLAYADDPFGVRYWVATWVTF